ncbi:MAG: hypothetical protein JWO59_2916 [Chloroflexi bacterium]|nr:hypothetical protein [Chloroflexota bacterium]
MAKGTSCASGQAHSCRARVVTIPPCAGSAASPGMTCTPPSRWLSTWRGKQQVPRRLATVIALCLKRGPKHRLADLDGGGLQGIQCGPHSERGAVDLGEVNGGEFGHPVRARLIDAADQDADMAHGGSFP